MAKISGDELFRLHGEGWSQKQLAAHFGCSIAAISKRLKKGEVPEVPESFKELTPKEQRFVIAKASGKTVTESALSSHDVTTRKSAKTLGHKLMKKPKVEQALKDVMDSCGLTVHHKVRRLKHWTDSKDGTTSLRALDMGFKLRGSYEQPSGLLNLNIIQVLQQKTQDSMRDYYLSQQSDASQDAEEVING